MPDKILNNTKDQQALSITNDDPWKKPLEKDPVFAFYQSELLLTKDSNSLPLYKDIISFIDNSYPLAYNGIVNQQNTFSAIIDKLSEQYYTTGLRELISMERELFFYAAGRAAQLMNWLKTNKYCGVCGSKNIIKINERALTCPECSNLEYPKISPAIITAVVKDDKILMAKSTRSAYTNYSVLAGFVEAGESLESAVHREVYEECGITVKNLRYINSQPWPFPNTLMCGFMAEWKNGDIKIDPKEIMTADWFSRDQLPKLPLSFSISRQLIEIFLKEV